MYSINVSLGRTRCKDSFFASNDTNSELTHKIDYITVPTAVRNNVNAFLLSSP
jgi:hypothetical protein